MGIDKICCEHFKGLIKTFDWFTFSDDNFKKTLVMPCFKSTLVRINYCPICGKSIRDIKLTESAIKQIGL